MTLIEHFNKWCCLTPNAIAIIDKNEKITYQELDKYSDAIADKLIKINVGIGDFIPIEAVRTVDFVIGLLAIVKVGAAYSIIDTSYSIKRKVEIVEKINAKVILTCLSDMENHYKIKALSISELKYDNYGNIDYIVDPSEPLYVVFTSGTMGAPKGVVIEHSSIEQFLVWHNNQFTVNHSSRFTAMAALGFDVLQWEVWAPIIAGGTLYILDEEIRRDAELLVNFFDEECITHAFVSTVMIPDVIAAERKIPKKLQYLFTGGEKLPPVNIAHLPYKLIDCYGATEASIWSTWYEVTNPTQGEPSSIIGKPRERVELMVLNQNFCEVIDGEIGQICIAGPSLARGYLNDELQTNKNFIKHPTKDNERIYCTGDFGKKLEDGRYQFLGRIGNQAKIHSYIVNLNDIDTVIARIKGVKHVYVGAFLLEEMDEMEIIAFVILNKNIEKNKKAIIDIRNKVNSVIPEYMRPIKYLLVDFFPRTKNGKIDKHLLSDWAECEIKKIKNKKPEQLNSVEKSLFHIFAHVLGHCDFLANDSFFDIGGYSRLGIKVAKMISSQFNISFSVSDLYRYPSINSLMSKVFLENKIVPLNPIKKLKEDALLPEDITFNIQPAYDNKNTKKHILLIGATGFIGVHLFTELLKQPELIIHCLIRANDQVSALERLKQCIFLYKIKLIDWDMSRIKVHAGDMSKYRLGLSPDTYESLCQKITMIYHSASDVNFIKPYGAEKSNDIAGIISLIRFASMGKKKVMILLSTISVYSWGHHFTGKNVMSEGEDIDQNLPAIELDTGYVKAKWVVEKLVQQAQARGMPLMIFRLGYATYHSQSGVTANYQWWGNLVKTCIKYQAIPDLTSFNGAFTSVDYICKSITHISKNSHAIDKVFNLVPAVENTLMTNDFFILLENYFNYQFERLPLSQWCEMCINDSNSLLYSMLAVFEEPIYNDKSLIELYQYTYHFMSDNTEQFLQGSGIEQPKFDQAELYRYLINLGCM